MANTEKIIRTKASVAGRGATNKSAIFVEVKNAAGVDPRKMGPFIGVVGNTNSFF